MNNASVESLLFAALEKPTEAERNAFLDSACAGNAELRRQVEKLLQAHANAGDFLQKPVVEQLAAAAERSDATQALDPSTGPKEENVTRTEGEGASDHERSDLGFLLPSDRADSLGRIGHYEVLQVLGKGGFGIVFRAFDDILQRVVALKVMSSQLAATSPARKRFLREARTSAQVRHENVVQVHEVGEQPLPYLVMEFIPGETLQQRLDRVGPVEPAEVVRVGRQIAEGLVAAHATDLIHRDIKPGNILLEGGQLKAKITDFGLARAADDASISQSGIIAGTPMYMAPEQAKGEKLDQRADLFSLGSVLYQMASGRPPFRANSTVAVLKRVADDTPRDIREIIPETPQWLCDIIAKLHAKNPAERFQSARELADVLADCEAQLKANSKLKDHSRIPPSTEQPSGTRRWAAAAAVLLPVLALAVTELAGVTHLFRDQPTTSDRQQATNNPAKQGDGKVAKGNKPTGWHGWPADAPPPAIAPFDAKRAKAHQEAWAKYLGVPVEYTNSIGMKFRLIPPGEFLMGSTPAEIETELTAAAEDTRLRLNSEAPQHKVILTKPLYVGITEVTQAKYEQVMGTNPSYFSATGEGKEAVANLETGHHPVEMVSWNDAAEFCAKLSRQEKLKPFYLKSDETVTPLDGTGYRLPTEAEWEHACRAGTTTRFWSGDTDDDLASAGWCPANSGLHTHAVGELKANPFGLSDMHGNAWEWVHDSFDPAFYGKFTEGDAVDPSSPFAAVSLGVVRGGSWGDDPGRCRSSFRVGLQPPIRTFSSGFRLVLPVDAVKQRPSTPPAARTSQTPFRDADVNKGEFK